jgi:hypothetical protein
MHRSGRGLEAFWGFSTQKNERKQAKRGLDPALRSQAIESWKSGDRLKTKEEEGENGSGRAGREGRGQGKRKKRTQNGGEHTCGEAMANLRGNLRAELGKNEEERVAT